MGMWKKVWNAMRYGDRNTKCRVGSVILFAILFVMSTIIAIALKKPVFFIVGLFCIVVALIQSQTFTLVEEDCKQETKSQEPIQELEENRFDAYDGEKLRQVKKKHRLKKDHRPIIIDSSKVYGIRECPAFIWRVHNKVHLLLLEKEPRHIVISRDLIRHMDYEPNKIGNPLLEYRAFQKKNMITGVFGEFLPDYYNAKGKTGNIKYKHLYKIYPDICISNRSAASVMDLLVINFMPEDKVTCSEKLNGFFKRIYSSFILYQDKVIGIRDYKEQVEQALRDMCYAEIPMREFYVTMENLVKGKMISTEYADYYINLKEKQNQRS